MKRLWLVFGLLLAGQAGMAEAKPLQVVASFTVIADMARQVGGDEVQVRSLVGPDSDPHVYEPTPADAQALRQADLVLVSGLNLEGWMDRLIKASGYAKMPVVLSEGVPTRRMEEDGESIVDPHAWNSAANGVIYVRNIVAALSAADPANEPLYRANGERYEASLQELDSQARMAIATIPASQRKVLTSHDAFGYFGDAYGVTFLSPVGFSTESEPSAAVVGQLISQIKQQHVGAYFIENASDPRLVKQIAQASGAQSGGALYVEALSGPDGPAPTYVQMFRYNLDRLVEAMQKGSGGK